jgi:hypothetical protein
MSENLPEKIKCVAKLKGNRSEYKTAMVSLMNRLVELGFATRTIVQDNERSGYSHEFTQEGLMLQKQISKIFAAANRGGLVDFYEVQAFMAIMARRQLEKPEN